MAAAFEFCAVAVEHPARGDQHRLVLEAREGEEHLVIDQKQASVCRLGAALERQGHLLDLDDAARRRERCEVVRHRYLPVTRLHRESVLFDLAGTVCERNGQRSIPNRVDNRTSAHQSTASSASTGQAPVCLLAATRPGLD
jgi:hypothetical protein